MKSIYLTLLVCLTAFGLACGYSSKTSAPVPGTTPTLSQLSPDNVDAGGPDLMVTVNGTHFNADAAVNLNGNAGTTTFVSTNQVMVKIPAASTATAGTVTVTVTNPGHAGGGIYGSGGTLAATSNPMMFTVN